MADANYPGSGTYKALIVDGTNRIASLTNNVGDGQVDWVLKASTDYTRVDGTSIMTTNLNSIFVFGTLTNSFASSGTSLRTGFRSGWTTNAGDHCTAWTTNSGAVFLRIGDPTSTTSNSINFGNGNCSAVGRTLVCVEQ